MHDIELKLTGCVGIVISPLKKNEQINTPTKTVKFRCSELFWQNSEFSPIFGKKSQFSATHVTYDVIIS